MQEDSIASIRARGLLGDKYISISPGASSNVVPAGGRIRETESPPDITDLIGKLIGTMFFVSGITTLLQTTWGNRLPLVQGR